MRGLRRWSVAAGSAGRRFFCRSGNLQVAAGGAGVHRYVSMSADAAILRGGHLPAHPSSYAAYHGACSPRGFRPRAQLGNKNAPSENKLFISAAILGGGHLPTPPSSYAAYHGDCSPRGRRFRPRAQLGDENAPSENKLKKEKAGRTLEEFVDANPRAIAFLKLAGVSLCICVCYLSAKGNPRVKLLVETAKDTAEVYAFFAMVIILLKKIVFPGSKRGSTSES